MKTRSVASIWTLLVLLCAGCSSPSGLGYENLWLQATQNSGGATISVGSKCTTLPRLLGSQVEDQLALPANVSAQIVATRDYATVRFENTVGGEQDTHTVSEQLLEGTFNESFSVSSTSGSSFEITLNSRCQ